MKLNFTTEKGFAISPLIFPSARNSDTFEEKTNNSIIPTMFGKSSILFPLPGAANNHRRSSSVSWKSNYDVGICIQKHLSRGSVPFPTGVSHSTHVPRPFPPVTSHSPFQQSFFPAIFRHNATSLWTGTFNSIWPHRALPFRPTYVCLHVCVCVPEQVLSSFRLTLLVQTRRTVWRFEPSSPSLSLWFHTNRKPPSFLRKKGWWQHCRKDRIALATNPT